MKVILKVYLSDFSTPEKCEQVFSFISKLRYENEGILFIEIEAGYDWYSNEHIYKWKSPDLNTIDF